MSTAVSQPHSPAWVIQCWLSFLVSAFGTSIGIWYLPADNWVKGFLAMGMLSALGSGVTLAKTVRDVHEANRVTARIDEARFNRLVAEHDPLKPAT